VPPSAAFAVTSPRPPTSKRIALDVL
jgi:hypothetical protein